MTARKFNAIDTIINQITTPSTGSAPQLLLANSNLSDAQYLPIKLTSNTLNIVFDDQTSNTLNLDVISNNQAIDLTATTLANIASYNSDVVLVPIAAGTYTTGANVTFSSSASGPVAGDKLCIRAISIAGVKSDAIFGANATVTVDFANNAQISHGGIMYNKITFSLDNAISLTCVGKLGQDTLPIFTVDNIQGVTLSMNSIA